MILFYMPRKIKELIRNLKQAGFVDRGGKGSHRNFVHPNISTPVTIFGKSGHDARKYQEKNVEKAIEEALK